MHNHDPFGAKCADIRPILREIDEGFDIVFDYDAESYRILFNGAPFQTVAYGQIDRHLIAEIRHTVWLNKTEQIFDYCDRSQERYEASQDRAQSRYAEALAKELRRPLVNSHLYGA